MQDRRNRDRAGGEDEAADHRPPRPAGKREKRRCGCADDEKRDRLQQVRADETAAGTGKPGPAVAGRDAQDADLGRLAEPSRQDRVEERADRARREDRLELDRAAERRTPGHRTERLGKRGNDERGGKQRPARVRRHRWRAPPLTSSDTTTKPAIVAAAITPGSRLRACSSSMRIGHRAQAASAPERGRRCSGNGILMTAGSTCAVTHTGVTA